ncbi:MAG: ATP-binding cassette domain-containing protein [Alphaproteobacteria bacterium]
MHAIAAEHLNRRFKDFVAVKDVSFTVEEGELFGFLGPNGAGKTTTINMLCTLLKPTGGAAAVNGFRVADQRSDVRRSIGLVFQDTTLDDYLSAEQNLRFHADAYGVPKSEYEPRMQALLELLELWDRRKETTRNYSGGMKRRLEIARGLLHHPKVLFLDEPTIGLDPQTRRHIWDHLRELRQRDNLTIFLTTHYMDEAEYCDRIAIIDHGEIVALDTPAKLKAAVGGDVVRLKAANNQALIAELKQRYNIDARLEEDEVTFTIAGGNEWLPKFVRESSQALLSLTLRGPTLEDVFIKITGHAIRTESADEMAGMRRWRRGGAGGGGRR